MLRYLLLLILCFAAFSLSAQGYFNWSPKAKQAYEYAIHLRFKAAQELLQSLREEEPNNLIALHVEDYIDFFTVFINEDEAEFTRLEKNKDRRLERIKKEGDTNSPYYRYIQADIRLHWALARLKFEEYTTTFFETNKAFKLLTKNATLFPNFIPNKKDLGLLHSIVGTIPDNYRWALEWVSSMEGTVQQGQRELEEVIAYSKANEFIFTTETYVFYAYFMLHLDNNEKEAWRLLNASQLNPQDSPMAAFVLANIAMRTNKTSQAIEILENAPKGAEFHTFPYLYYMLGTTKLHRLDTDADVYLLRYLNEFRGCNFIKDTYRRLSWHALLQGNISQFKTYQQQVIQKGHTIVGADESAWKEARANEVPNLDLLKARLLFDGGFYQRAYELLSSKNAASFTNTKDKLEFNYRIGRITHLLKNYPVALSYYQKTIDLGRQATWYYACRAALEMGKIYEALQQKEKAKAAFQTCLSIKPSEHKTGLHHQAKAGLARL